MPDRIRVEIVRRTVDAGGYLARINGVEVPVLAYGLEQAEDGTPVLSLAFTPDSLQIGDPSSGGEQPQVRPSAPEKAQPSTWGAEDQSDPRESIPGWQPEKLSGQVAENAVTRVEVMGMTGNELIDSMRRLIDLRRRGEGGSMAVLA
jgi:hypothetical protein